MPQRKLKLQAHLYLGEEDVPRFFHSVVLRLQLPAGQGQVSAQGLRPPGFAHLCTQHPLTLAEWLRAGVRESCLSTSHK